MVFISDDVKFGGQVKITKKVLTAVARPSHGKAYSIPVDLPKFTCLYLVREQEPTKEKTADKEKPASKKKTGGKAKTEKK